MSGKQRLERPLRGPEHVLLCLFVVALPLVEAPKNLLLWLFLVTWLVGSVRARNYGSQSRLWDGLFAAMFLVPLLCILCSGPFPKVWKEWTDVLGYALLGWALARSRQDEKQVATLLLCVVGATLAGLVQGFWMLAIDPKRVWLQLNSVGHVNHSALYGAGVGIMAVGLALIRPQGLLRKHFWVLPVAAFAMLGAMVVFASRGAFLAYGLGVATVLLCLYRQWAKVALAIVVAAVVGLAAQTLALQFAHSKNESTLLVKSLNSYRSGNLSSERTQLARTALEIWHQRPLTGVGPANFSAVSPAMIEAWVKARGEAYVPGTFLFSSHAHNLYLNTLAERGVLGEVFILLLAVAWAGALWRRRPGSEASARDKMCWVAGVAGGAVVFIGGVFNTTLHHEHGMLSAVGLALLLNLPEKQV